MLKILVLLAITTTLIIIIYNVFISDIIIIIIDLRVTQMINVEEVTLLKVF